MTVTSYQVHPRDWNSEDPRELNRILRYLQERLATLETAAASTASSTTDLTNTLIGIRKRLLKRSTDTDTPSNLTVAASANGMVLLFGVSVGKNAESVVEAHFRASYTNDLAVTSMNLSSPDIDASQITATSAGAIYKFTSDRPGRWYYAWRLRNEKGWGPWSQTMTAVTNYVDTRDAVDSGPPAGWTVTIEDSAADASLASNQIRVRATRPTTNGSNVLRWSWQIKDSSTGSWLALDNGAAPSGVLYDGSAINHEILDGGSKLKRSTGTGFGTAMNGDLILLDVTGDASFHVNYCQQGCIVGFLGADGSPVAEGSASAVYLLVEGFFHSQVNSGLKVKVVEPPWGWSTGGYLGMAGWGTQWVQSRPDREFVSPPITLGNVSYSSLDARVFWENHYSCSDSSATNGTPTVSSDAVAVSDSLKVYSAGAPTGARVEIDNANGVRIYSALNALLIHLTIAGIFKCDAFQTLASGSGEAFQFWDGDAATLIQLIPKVTTSLSRITTPGGFDNHLGIGPGSATGELYLEVNENAIATVYANGVNLASGKALYVNTTKVVGAQGSAVADANAVSAISLNAGADTVDRAAFNTALGTLVSEIGAIKDQLNLLLAAIRTHGLIASS